MASPKRTVSASAVLQTYEKFDQSVAEEKRKPGEEVLELDTEIIDPNPWQNRLIFSDERINELAEEIRQDGLLQPIVIRRSGDRYQLVFGEMRLRACRKAGVKVKSILRDYNDRDMARFCVRENNSRTNTSAYEDYYAIVLQRKRGLTNKEIMEVLNLKSADFYRTLSFDDLPDTVHASIRSEQHIDCIGKREAQELSQLRKSHEDEQQFSETVIEGMERLAAQALTSRAAMMKFIRQQLKGNKAASRPESSRKKSVAITEVLIEGNPVGQFKESDSNLTLSISKEQIPQDKYAELKTLLQEFFETAAQPAE